MLPSLTGFTMTAPVTSKKGGVKSAPIQWNGQPFTIILGSLNDPLRIPFSVTPFGAEEATRLTMNLEIKNKEHQEFLTSLDAKVLETLCESDYIKKPTETVKAMYKQCITDNTPYQPLLRAKINLEEPAKVRAWNQNGELVDLPDDLKNMKVAIKLRAKGVWMSSSMCGLTLDVTDIQICDQAASVDMTCPFEVAVPMED